jgi:hypothetical protein
MYPKVNPGDLNIDFRISSFLPKSEFCFSSNLRETSKQESRNSNPLKPREKKESGYWRNKLRARDARKKSCRSKNSKSENPNCNKSKFLEKMILEKHVKTRISFIKVRTFARVDELRNESRKSFGVPFPSWETSTKFSRGSGTVHRTKNRKIDSSERIKPKFSREWSPDILSIVISSLQSFEPTNQETEEVEEKCKKTKKTREESRENRRKTRKSSRKIGNLRRKSGNPRRNSRKPREKSEKSQFSERKIEKTEKVRPDNLSIEKPSERKSKKSEKNIETSDENA